MSADSYRARMAELNVEIEKVQHEMNEREGKGRPTVDLEKDSRSWRVRSMSW